MDRVLHRIKLTLLETQDCVYETIYFSSLQAIAAVKVSRINCLVFSVFTLENTSLLRET